MGCAAHNKIDVLEQTIRSGCRPNCPQLIYEYFDLGFKRSVRRSSSLKVKGHERAFHTLLETICDPLVPKHWRQTCLDNIYIPLLWLQREAQTDHQRQQVMKMKRDLRTLSTYFL